MPKSEKIRVMISSRCKATIDYNGKSVLLSELRKILKKEIQSIRLRSGQSGLFDCWINEDSPSSPMNETWWERCLNEARQADLVIVLYNGESGGSIKGEPMGICHAELEALLATQSKKVRGIPLLPLAPLPKDSLQRKCDESFRTYVDNLDIFGPPANNGKELIERVHQELKDALVSLVQSAAVTPDLSKSNTGPALEWHRMSYSARERAMRDEVRKVLADVPGTKPGNLKPTEEEWMTMWLMLGGKRILAALHAVPAGLSQSAAREKVGQPFLMDHTLHADLAAGDGGPLHIVSCYKGATESQALKMLGFPDATLVPGRFGLHVADSVQKIQIVLLKNCQSPTATRSALTAWLEWLQRSEEDKLVAARAAARKRIINAIAKENVPI
jgi:hypothetical protein